MGPVSDPAAVVFDAIQSGKARGRDPILIDTGAIFAFVTRTDSHHEAAKRFVREWLDQEGIFVLPDIVFAETMSVCVWPLQRPAAAVAVYVPAGTPGKE